MSETKTKEKKMAKKMKKKAIVNGGTFHTDENSFLLYLQEISRFPVLSKEEEEVTAKLVCQGDKAAREKLINSNLRFVIMVAKKYQGRGLPLEDLISEGNIGLISAVHHFDIRKGFRFITYAVWWIRQALIKAIHEKSRMIRLPSNKNTDLSKIEKTRQALMHEPGCKSDEEIRKIAQFLDMPIEKAVDLIQLDQDVLSLDDPFSNDGNTSAIKDFIQDDYLNSPIEQTMNKILREELEDILSCLEERASDVIHCRYGLGDTGPLTLKEVGARYNLSRERVRQIEKRALGQIQHSSRGRKLESYIA